jgi:membrane associated rhomboid family serine protease
MISLRDSQPSYSKPYVTIALIAVNAFVFLFQLTLDEFSLNNLLMSYGMIPSRLHASSLVTSMFLHGGWLHLIGNMWFLWIFGDNIEDILGRAKYLLFYLLCGVAAALVHVAFNGDSRVPTIGASGAIAGVMGACIGSRIHGYHAGFRPRLPDDHRDPRRQSCFAGSGCSSSAVGRSAPQPFAGWRGLVRTRWRFWPGCC